MFLPPCLFSTDFNRKAVACFVLFLCLLCKTGGLDIESRKNDVAKVQRDENSSKGLTIVYPDLSLNQTSGMKTPNVQDNSHDVQNKGNNVENNVQNNIENNGKSVELNTNGTVKNKGSEDGGVKIKNLNTTHVHGFDKNSEEDPTGSGAALRLFYVMLGLSVLCLMYFVIKSYRLRKGSQPSASQQIRKYGVMARRGDVEMLPLPLEEEEDDDTVFDVGNHSNR